MPRAATHSRSVIGPVISVSAGTVHSQQAPPVLVPKASWPSSVGGAPASPSLVRYSGRHSVPSSGQFDSSLTDRTTSRLSLTSSRIRGGAGTSLPHR